MDAFDDPRGRQFRPHTFRPSLFQGNTNPSPRVSTDPARPAKKPHLHGLHHHPHKHRHRHSRHAKDAVQSAVQLQAPTSFGDLLKPTSRSRANSPRSNRRERETRDRRDAETEDLLLMPVRPEDIALERERAQAREEYV